MDAALSVPACVIGLDLPHRIVERILHDSQDFTSLYRSWRRNSRAAEKGSNQKRIASYRKDPPVREEYLAKKQFQKP